MKSLEKDRTHRYETPNGLASDISVIWKMSQWFARGPSTTTGFKSFCASIGSRVIIGCPMALVAGGSVVILSMWNRDRLQWLRQRASSIENVLSQAASKYAKADREAPLKPQPILTSRHVGPEGSFCMPASLLTIVIRGGSDYS